MEIDITKLKGKHVYLRLLQPTDRETIRPMAKDDRIWEFTKGLMINDTYDEQFDRYFDLALDEKGLGGQQAFIIHDKATDAIIGMTRIYEYNPKDKKAAIGYTWYTPAVWTKVYNKECKLLLFQYLFETLQFNRVELHVAGQNVRSQKAVEKVGGVKEGVLRKHGYRPDGSLRDTVMFSIIDDEWPGKKEKLLQLIKEW
jgi:N-acetyltransferase